MVGYSFDNAYNHRLVTHAGTKSTLLSNRIKCLCRFIASIFKCFSKCSHRGAQRISHVQHLNQNVRRVDDFIQFSPNAFGLSFLKQFIATGFANTIICSHQVAVVQCASLYAFVVRFSCQFSSLRPSPLCRPFADLVSSSFSSLQIRSKTAFGSTTSPVSIFLSLGPLIMTRKFLLLQNHLISVRRFLCHFVSKLSQLLLADNSVFPNHLRSGTILVLGNSFDCNSCFIIFPFLSRIGRCLYIFNRLTVAALLCEFP